MIHESELINELEKMLKRYDELELFLSEKYVDIMDEVDEKGKGKFSNSEKRELELRKRFEKDYLERLQLKRSIEIQRFKLKYFHD